MENIINLNPQENKTKIIPFTKESLISRLEYLYMIKIAHQTMDYLKIDSETKGDIIQKLIHNFHSKIYSTKNYNNLTKLNNLEKPKK